MECSLELSTAADVSSTRAVWTKDGEIVDENNKHYKSKIIARLKHFIR